MRNIDFKKAQNKNKYMKLKNLIKAKAYLLSDEDIEKIIKQLNLNRQYSIVATNDINVFKKNVYQENKFDDGYSYNVVISKLLGDFVCGNIDCDGQIVLPFVNPSKTIAFLKEITIEAENKKNKTFVLFIYTPKLNGK